MNTPIVFLIPAVLIASAGSMLAQTDGNWDVNASGNWSDVTNWSSDPNIPGGQDSNVGLDFNITTNIAVTMDSGISRTVGHLNIGDSVGSSDYSLQSAGSETLTFDVSSGDATLNFQGDQNTINTDILLDDSLVITNSTSNNNFLFGSMSAGSSGTKTITNAGTGSGPVFMELSISDGAGTVAVRQNSATSIMLMRDVSNTVANTFSGGFWIDAGEIRTQRSNKLGSGEVHFADGTAWSTIGGESYSNTINFTGEVTLKPGGNLSINDARLDTDVTFVSEPTSGKLGFASISENVAGLSLTKEGFGGLRILNGQATHTGGTFINEGILELAGSTAGNRLVSTAPVTIDGGSLLNSVVGGSANQTVGDITLISGSIEAGSASNSLTTTSMDVRSGTISMDMAGASNLTKSTAGTVEMTADNTYTGGTFIDGGTLLVSGTGAINGTSAVTINSGGNFSYSSSTGLDRDVALNTGGTFTHNGSTNYTGTLTWTGGTLAGTNYDGVTLTVGTDQTLSPGNSPGTMTTAAQTWEDGGNYNLQVYDVDGAAGTGFDTIEITGGLDLTGLTAGGFEINLWSLSSIGPDVNGDAINFDNLDSYSWMVLSTTTGITGFDASDFMVNTAATNGTAGFSNALGGGTFSVSSDSTNLFVDFTAIPEPGTWALIGLGLAATLLRVRRR